MTRLTLVALLAGSLAGPWSGCDRQPVTPPAAPPPPEQAPSEPPARTAPSDDGTVLLAVDRRLA